MNAAPAAAELRAATRAALGVRLAAGGWAHPVRAAACMAVPLSAGVIAGRPSYGMLASLGALAGLYGQGEPFRRRARLMAAIAVALAAAVVAGTLASSSAVATVLVVGAIAAIATSAICCASASPTGSR